MQQKSSSSNSNGQFVTIADKDRAEIIRQVNSDFSLKATSWNPLGNGNYKKNEVKVFGNIQNQGPIIIENKKFFREVFVPNIAKDFLTQNKNSTTLSDLFNAPSTLLDPRYNKLDVQYIILSEMNRILMQTAAFYRLNLNTLKEQGWDFESFEAVKEFKKANVAPKTTPKTTGPMDRFAKSGVAMTSSATPSTRRTPPSPKNSLNKIWTRTPKTALATSVDSSNSPQSDGSSVASSSDHKQAAAATHTTAAAAVPAALPNSNDSSEASTSLKDPRNQPVAAALLVVNAGQDSNNVSIAVSSASSTAVASRQLSTPKKDTTVSFNVSATGRITPLSPRAANYPPTKRTSHIAGLDQDGSPYKAPSTKENRRVDRSPSF